MKYISLLDNINKAFSSFAKPLIIYAAPANIDITKGDYSAIQQDYGNVSRDEMTYEQCSMMVVDGVLISDESLCYFLPRLARAVFQEGANGYLLYRRLKHFDKYPLNQEQKKILECFITSLRELEQEIEMEEERELREAQTDF